MAIPGYLAMTPARIRAARTLPRGLAWMSCRFSDRGLLDLPRRLPEGSLLVLEDSVPLSDPDAAARQLGETAESLRLSGVLLDFQKAVDPALSRFAAGLSLPCPVAVSEAYSSFTDGPVFLDLVPASERLSDHCRPYRGRELWLELGPGAQVITVTREGAQVSVPRHPLPPCPHGDLELCCHYGLELQEDRAVFTLFRSQVDLRALLGEAEDLGVTRYVGLFGDLPGLL